MRKEILLVLTLFLSVTAVFFHPVFQGKFPFPGDLLVGGYPPYNTNSYDGYSPGGVTNKAQGPDVIRQLLPWKHLSIDIWKSGNVPLWNPYNFSGSPLMANFQSGVFYPFNLLFLLPFLMAWTMYIALIPLLFALFTYLFLRELRISKTASLFAGITTAFSSYTVVWLEYGNVGHTFLWLPLVLYFTEKLLKKFQLRFVWGIIGALWFSFLAGYIQGYFYEVIVCTFYFFGKLYVSKKLSLKQVGLVLLLLTAPLLLSSFQLLPTLELFVNSARNNYSLESIEKLLNPYWYLVTTVIPNFFGHPAARNHWFYGTYIERVSYFGFIPFVFALFALTLFKKRVEIKLFGILLLFSMALSTNLFITKYVYLLPIPIISTTVPTRILSIFVFSGSVLAGFGLDYFLNKEESKTYWKVFVGICSILLGAWIFVFIAQKLGFETIEHMAIAKRNLYIPTLLAVLTFGISFLHFKQRIKLKHVVILAIFSVTVFDLLYFFDKITPFAPAKYLYPDTEVFSWVKQNGSIDRVWGYGSGSIESNITTFEKLYSPDGYDPLYPKEYGQIMSSSKDGTVSPARSEAMIQPGYGKEDLRKNTHRQTVLNLVGVKYILDKTEVPNANYEAFPQDIYSLDWHEGVWSVYQNRLALPRVALFYDYHVENDLSKQVSMIHDPSFPLHDKLILTEALPNAKLLKKDLHPDVRVVSYSPNKLVIKTSSSEDGLLFVSDNFYPGWNVTVDGLFDKIYKADYSFRAVLVPKGNHEVVFSYDPSSFRVGLSISFVAFILLASAGFVYGKKNKD